jgi:cobalt-zinc-cadmium efflux system membrane fusion protein
MHRPTLSLAAAAVAVLAAGAALATGDAHDHEPADPARTADEHDHDEDHGAVRLDGDERAEFGIELAAAGPDTIETWVALPGEVHPNEDRLAHIVPRYSGIATEVRARIGDDVARGQALAVVESDESLAPFEVRTLIAGTVIAKHISLGEAVSRDRDVYVIADLSSVWIDLTVYQRDLDRVRVGQPVRLLVGHEPAPDAARISYVTPVVDESTRTATARVVLPNPDGAWRPGMFVTGRVLLERAVAGVAVPRSALHTVDGTPVVFVEEEGGLRPRPVRIGRGGEDHVELLDGLAPGERYVRAGGFTLKAELAKESFGDGHAH